MREVRAYLNNFKGNFFFVKNNIFFLISCVVFLLNRQYLYIIIEKCLGAYLAIMFVTGETPIPLCINKHGKVSNLSSIKPISILESAFDDHNNRSETAASLGHIVLSKTYRDLSHR